MSYIVNALPKSHVSTKILFVEILDGENRYILSIGHNIDPARTGQRFDIGFGASSSNEGRDSSLVTAKSLGWDGASREGAVKALEAFNIDTTHMTDAQLYGRHINFTRLATILDNNDVQNRIIDLRGAVDPDVFLPAVRGLLKEVSILAKTPIKVRNFRLQTTFWQIKPAPAAVVAAVPAG